MGTRRNFLKISGAAAAVGLTAFGIASARPQEVEKTELYSDIEKVLSEENPDIPADTIKAIATDYGKISTSLKAGTAGVSALSGAIFNHFALQDKGSMSLFSLVISGLIAHGFIAGAAIEEIHMDNKVDLRAALQSKYGLSEVQSIHVEKSLRNKIADDFSYEYGLLSSLAGAGVHNAIHKIFPDDDCSCDTPCIN